jgi:hypothetical protein
MLMFATKQSSSCGIRFGSMRVEVSIIHVNIMKCNSNYGQMYYSMPSA